MSSLFNNATSLNIKHYISNNGVEKHIELNENNDIVHYIDSDHKEYFYEYDDKGRRVHYRDNKGYQIWYTYDHEYPIACIEKTSSGVEIHYNSNNKRIYHKDSYGYESYYRYDDNGNLISITRNPLFISKLKAIKRSICKKKV